ncbi:MAG: hypothetical protein GF315_10925 [candidate division Zixibacteria bacterium]|nr:hypothetical protein [candidate division Zixibacteria bacterium]
MDCPKCKNPLIALELEQIEIDHCTDCGGIWLDSGELELLFNDYNRAVEFIESFSMSQDSGERSIKCPICLKKMEKVSVPTEQTILIDRCINDDGLWFDVGELERTLRSGKLDPDNPVFYLLKEMFKNRMER